MSSWSYHWVITLLSQKIINQVNRFHLSAPSGNSRFAGKLSDPTSPPALFFHQRAKNYHHKPKNVENNADPKPT